MKRMVMFAVLFSMLWITGSAQVTLKTTHNYFYPLGNPVLSGLGSIRCVAVAKNLEGDGKTLIAATN